MVDGSHREFDHSKIIARLTDKHLVDISCPGSSWPSLSEKAPQHIFANGTDPDPALMIIASRPPPAERTTEYKPFHLVPRHPDDPRVPDDITPGPLSLTASQLVEQEALSRKNASCMLSLAEYVYN